MPVSLDQLLRSLRRQIWMIRLLQVMAIALLVCALLWAARLPGADRKAAVFGIEVLALLIWGITMVHTVRIRQEIQAGNVMMSYGDLDVAERWLRRAMSRSSLTVQGKLIAAQQLAWLSARRDAHDDVIAICGELLRHRIKSLRSVWINARLMLADSLLMLDRTAEAYTAMRPVYDLPLSLAERMKLLPIQLRYELASDHSAAAVTSLPEKVRLAELLDSPRAALVHALLAEACRRESLPAQHAYLIERARLYHDLESLSTRYPIIAPVAAPSTPSRDAPAP